MDDTERAEIRQALRLAVAERGLRAVARQIGMSPTNLGKLLEGSRPHAQTWDRLRTWYASAAPALNRVEAEAGRAALSLLERGVSPELRGAFRTGLVALVAKLYGQAGIPAPAWLAQEPGGMEAFEEGRREREVRFATVELRGAEPVALIQQPFAGQPRMVVEAIGVQRGVWSGNTYYPPHRIVRIRMGGG